MLQTIGNLNAVSCVQMALPALPTSGQHVISLKVPERCCICVLKIYRMCYDSPKLHVADVTDCNSATGLN